MTTTTDKLKGALTHPGTVGLAGLLALLGIAKGGLVWALLMTVWANAGTIFTASSIFSFTLAPNVGAPPWAIEIGTAAALTSGAVLLAKLGRKLWENFEARLR